MASTSSFGTAIDGTSSAGLIADQARASEDGGAETMWIATHLFLRDPVALAARALSATRTLKVALMAISPYAVHPVQAAMSAATLHELYPGRIILSLGAGAPADFAAAGIERTRPLATLRDSIEICRSLFSGKALTERERVFPVAGRQLVNAPVQVPIILAASGPGMLAVAGRHADGVVLSGATSVPFVSHCLQIAAEHRNDGAFQRAGIVYACIEDDLNQAVEPLRKPLGTILRGDHHRLNLHMGGASLDQNALRNACADGDWTTVEQLVTNETVAAHAACGTAEQVSGRLKEYGNAGLDHVILSGIVDPAEIYATLSAVQ